MSYELTGKLVEKFDTVEISDTFRKREFVVEKEEYGGGNVFTDMIKFQLTQDRCNLIDDMNLNDEIKVLFNIRGRKWEKGDKVNYFTNLEAWRIEKVTQESPGTPDHTPDDIPADTEVNDDLPF